MKHYYVTILLHCGRITFTTKLCYLFAVKLRHVSTSLIINIKMCKKNLRIDFRYEYFSFFFLYVSHKLTLLYKSID